MREIAKRRKILLLASVVLGLLFFVSFMYTDIVETTRDGMTFWDALFSGRLRQFYVMNENVTISGRFGTSGAAIYDFPVYFVFAIWNLPLWIYEKVTGAFALDRLVGVLWAKSISIPFLIGICLTMIRIGKRIRGDAFPADKALLMFGSSVLFLVPVLIMGQYDAFCLLFMLLGTDAYIAGKNKQFLAWFAVAVTFKLFALFVFIPLVLLKEKRLLRVCGSMAAGLSFLVFWKIVQGSFFVVSETGTDYVSGHLLTFIFQSQIGFTYQSSSVFIMAFLFVCMFCYFRTPIPAERSGIWAVYGALMGLAPFFIASLTHPQWSLLMLPFIVLLVFARKDSECATGMWISTIFSSGLLLAQFIYYFWVFSIKTSAYTLAGKLFYNGTDDPGYSIRNLLEARLPGMDMGYLNMIGGGVFAAGLLFFLFWAYPDAKRRNFAALEISFDSILVVRLFIFVVTGGLLVALMV